MDNSPDNKPHPPEGAQPAWGARGDEAAPHRPGHKSPRRQLGGFHPTANAMLLRMAELDANIDPRIFPGEIKYSMADMGRLAGTTTEHVFELTRQIGSTPRDADVVRYTDLDLQAVQAAVEFQKSENLSDETMGTLLRGMGFAMERLTTRQVEAQILHNAETRGVSDTEARLLAAEQTPDQTQTFLRMLEHVYRRQLVISTRRLTVDTIMQRGLHTNDDAYPIVRAIGFADLVNFTERTEKLSPKEFTEVIRDFREKTWDIINRARGRTINYIGDAVFFVADTIEEGAQIALGLAAAGELGVAGQVRVGLVWSRVIAIFGDAYGPGVNLAARLCAVAEPSEVWIDPAAARLLSVSGHYAVEPRPAFEARGIGLVEPSRLRYADDAHSVEG